MRIVASNLPICFKQRSMRPNGTLMFSVVVALERTRCIIGDLVSSSSPITSHLNTRPAAICSV